MKFVELSEVVRNTGDINEKFDHVVKVLTTAATANTNAVIVLIDALKATPGFDVAAFKKQLSELKDSPPQALDINGPLHSQIISTFISRLD